MKSWRVFFLSIVGGLAFLYVPSPISSQGISSVNARVGIGIPTSSISSNPQIVQLAPSIELFGVGMDVQLTNFLFLSPFVDFSVQEVLYSSKTKLVHPRSFVNIADGGYTTMLVFYIGIPLLAYIPLGDLFRLGIGLSPTMAFRIPLDGRDRTTVGNYYIDNGRFFVPEAIINFGYAFQEIEFLLSARALFPISNLWDGDGSPFQNELTFAVTVQLRFILFKSSDTE